MQSKVYYINDMPFSMAFGGKEIQLLGYKSIIDKNDIEISVELLDPWDKDVLANNAALHFFGSGKWFHNLLIQAKQKSNVRKCIISPTFYYDKFWKIKIGEILSHLTPLENQFSYKRYIFSAVDVIVVNSNAEGQQISQLFGAYLENKFVVIPNTIDDNFTQFSNTDCFLKAYKIDPGYILSIGFMDERKNSIEMIKAFLRTYNKTKRKLVIVGGFRFLNAKNKEIAMNLISGNADKIKHINFLPAKSDLIKSAYFNCICHFLPSYVETPGIANLEALSFGKPIIVGDCPPVREYFNDYAIFCKPDCPDSLDNSIIRAVNDSFLESNGFDFVRANYTHESISKKLVDIYNL
jgi:glycosyltransferase involved in cell wall biosynthesis